MAFQDANGQWYDDNYNPIADPNSYNSGVSPRNDFSSMNQPLHPTNGISWDGIPGKDAQHPGPPPAPPPVPPPAPPPVPPNPQTIYGNMPSVADATPPPFDYANFINAAPFSYDAFSAPTGQQALDADPGYQFRVDQGTGALQNSAAARGVLNTGGTLQDLINYGQQAGSQEYQNAYGRAANTYDMNRNNAYQNYNTNETNRFNDYVLGFGNALTKYNTNYGTQYQTPYNQLMQQYGVGMQAQNQNFNQQFATATA